MKIAQTIVVVGDIHSELALAAAALDRVEEQFGPIAQVFSVGDVGLFLERGDWEFLTGPKKHRHPERSGEIAAAWKEWRWPLSMIGGNHEPYQWLREFASQRFGGHLDYINAGILSHHVPGLQVYGLSGIHHPEHMTFASGENLTGARPQQWVDLVQLAAAKKVSLKRLTYYKQTEIDRLLALPRAPDLLLLHDWPVPPPHVRGSTRRPERDIVERLAPKYVCSGHHHTPAEIMLGPSRFIGLNIISSREEIRRRAVSPGWAAIFSWDGAELERCAIWPAARRLPVV